MRKTNEDFYETLRALIREQGIPFAELSKLTRQAGLNYGRGYGATSLSTILREQRAQPDLLEFLTGLCVDNALSKINFLGNEIALETEKITRIRTAYAAQVQQQEQLTTD